MASRKKGTVSKRTSSKQLKAALAAIADADSSDPKILLFDTETFPMVVNTWGVYEQNAIKIIRPTIVCSFVAKWIGGKTIVRALCDYDGYLAGSTDDEQLIRDLWALIDEADIVIAQNGDKFDIRKINARFIKHGLPPPRPYRTVDTLKVAKRVFGFDSNKLDNLCEFLDIGRKVSTGGFSLWDKCLGGDRAAWAKMKSYNKHDVQLLHDLYKRMLPWINNHPNLGMWFEGGCPKCGSMQLQSRGYRRTNAAKYRQFQCQSCGGWCRSKKSEGKTGIVNV